MNVNPRQAFFRALSLFKDDDLDGAETLCKKLLLLNPKDVNSLRLYGQIVHRRGNLAEAQKAFAMALDQAPDYAHAHMDLGFVKRDAEDYAGAEHHLHRALALDGGLHAARRALHEVLMRQGKDAGARELETKLRERDRVTELVERVTELFRKKDYAAFERASREVLESNPANLAVMAMLADYASSELNVIRAESLFRRITARAPENWRAWNGLCRSLLMQDRPEEAAECLGRSREIEPDARESRLLEADICIKQYDYEAGIRVLDELLAERPDFNAALAQSGYALKTVGRQDEAVQRFRRCIENDPGFGEAWWSLSDMKTFAFETEDVQTMEHILLTRDLSDKNRVYFGYALGKAYEHDKDYVRAFEHYDRANRVQRKLVAYDADENTALTDRIIETFTPEFFERHARKPVTPDIPVFIVGLPRSGSTLLEQILASHSMVEGTQELPYMPRLAKWLDKGKQPMTLCPFPEGAKELDEKGIASLAKRYLERAGFHRRDGTLRFIDKLPNNFVNIGLIRLCFPGAGIINARRDPLDSCLGCFKQLWAMGQTFTYDLVDLGRYYRDYDRLMRHWHAVLPGGVLDVHYSDVVNDLESQVRRMLDFCDLEFEQACLEYHRTERVVRTSSSEQVRKPIYRSALAYWKNFEGLLDPLTDSLGDLAPVSADDHNNP